MMSIDVRKDGRFFTATCGHTGVQGHGTTPSNAMVNLEDALIIWRRSWAQIVGHHEAPGTDAEDDDPWPGKADHGNPLRSTTLQ